MKKKYCFILAAFLVWGCHSQTSSSSASNNNTNSVADTAKHTQVHVKPLDKGMTDTVFCTDDPKQKYAVYVPANYTSNKKWPIIYFFDPHGVGNVPLKLYKDLADKYGYILAGTYGTKNGMQWAESEKAAQAFMQDSWQRLSVDNSRIYTFGFSGGARVACSVALYDGGITGVAACGGAFPERSPNIKQAFTFIGFVGDKDFNYTELKVVDKELDPTPVTHQLVVYHGKHQWPPAAVAEQAFQWFDVNAMKLHFISKNDSMVKAIEQQFVKQADKEQKQGKEEEAYFTYREMLNYLRDLIDVDKYVTIVQDLEKSKKVEQYLKDEQTNERQEIQVQTEFINYLSDKDMDWWTGTIKEMRDFIKRDSLAPVALQNQRLLSYLSLATYMGAFQAFKKQNDGATAHFLALYNLVDPTNPEHSYMYACMYARQSNSGKALSSLEEAVKLGFNDARRIQQDSNFVAIKDAPAFKQLIKKIEAMPPKVDMTQ